MKHGVAFRKLSRDTSHRMLMLRNLVTSLFQHEQIKTTLPKARETARLAEQMISLGKTRGRDAYRRASAFVLDQSVLHKLFGPFAARYSARPGGYTRIHKLGNREGDNAPVAILELVDNPQDIKLEVTARAVGWELLKAKLQSGDVSDIFQKGVSGARELVVKELGLDPGVAGQLRPATRLNLRKVLRYRNPIVIEDFGEKAQHHINLLLAKPVLMRTLLDQMEKDANDPNHEKTKNSMANFEAKRASFYRDRSRPGQAPPGETKGALRLSQGALGRPDGRRHPKDSEEPKSPRYTFADIYEKRP